MSGIHINFGTANIPTFQEGTYMSDASCGTAGCYSVQSTELGTCGSFSLLYTNSGTCGSISGTYVHDSNQ